MTIVIWIQTFFQTLYDKTGVNFVIFYNPRLFHEFLMGAWTSFQLMFWSCLLSLVVGIFGAWLRQAKIPVASPVISIFTEIFRDTPPIIQMVFFYFALGSITPQVNMGGYYVPMISSLQWAIVSLGLFGGAYNIEIFRAGLEAVPTATIEASEALGLNKWQLYRHVTLPLALRISFPALGNNLLSLARSSSLAYVISVPEMTLTLKQIWSIHFNALEMILVLFVFYVTVISTLAYLFHRYEKWLSLPGFGDTQ